MRRAFLVSVLGAAVVFACGKTYESSNGPDDIDGGVEAGPDTSASVADTGVVDSGPAAPCPVGCLAPPPAGWTGPATVLETELDASPATCPLTYPTRENDTFHADGGPGDCTCGSSFFPGEAQLTTYSNVDCTDNPTPAVVFFNGCPPLPDGAVAFVMPTHATSSSAQIAADGSTESDVSGCCLAPGFTPPPPIEQTVITSCAARTSNVCPGRADCNTVEIPEQPFVRVCIHADGDVPCPNGDYSNRFISYRSVTDGRGCNPCVATPSSGTCALRTFADASACIDRNDGTPFTTDGGCTKLPWPSLQVDSILQTACEVDGGGPDGSIALDSPVTFCCAN